MKFGLSWLQQVNGTKGRNGHLWKKKTTEVSSSIQSDTPNYVRDSLKTVPETDKEEQEIEWSNSKEENDYNDDNE
ncbi:hypothetical protein EVAR_103260_1 [Eumeta japonica]|uniref:Uncharacterized protein n=1 Tax=Eumeta variegata TaxID=151549 RepID=A0A4C1YC68_EUMVA|nr:hypothetical protein EVAR_103260_1 [Eumeta japonica]